MMKRLLFLALTLLALICMTGCGQSNPGDSDIPDIDYLQAITALVQEKVDDNNPIAERIEADCPVYLNEDGKWICFQHGEIIEDAVAQKQLSSNWLYHYALVVANFNRGRYSTEAMKEALRWSVTELKESYFFSDEEEAQKFSIFVEYYYIAILERINEIEDERIETVESETSIASNSSEDEIFLLGEPLDD